jgi:hypothetical protein
MGGETHVKLAPLLIGRAARDLFRIVGFGVELLRAGLHVLHAVCLGGFQPGDASHSSM